VEGFSSAVLNSVGDQLVALPQRHPGRVRRDGQLPLRPDRSEAQPPRTCARSSPTTTCRSWTRPGRAALPWIGRMPRLARLTGAERGPSSSYRVARLSRLGVRGIQLRPRDPNLAHTRDEHVALSKVRQAEC